MQGASSTTTIYVFSGLPALALWGLTACNFNASYSDTQYRCDETGECPQGQLCESGICREDPAQSGRCGTLAAAVEDFERLDLTDVDERRWDYWSDDPGLMTIDHGQLVFSFPADAAQVGAGFGTKPIYALEHSAATVEIVDLSIDPGANIGLQLYTREDSRAGLYYQDGTLYAEYRESGHTDVKTLLPYDADAHRIWRVRELDGELLWETSADGVEFTAHESREVSAFGPWIGSYVGLWKQSESPEPVTVVLDNLNGAEIPLPLCASESLTDDFDDGRRGDAWQLHEHGECQVRETDGRLGFEFPESGE